MVSTLTSSDGAVMVGTLGGTVDRGKVIYASVASLIRAVGRESQA